MDFVVKYCLAKYYRRCAHKQQFIRQSAAHLTRYPLEVIPGTVHEGIPTAMAVA
jgi:hypothetical protein